jgi:hypothetical protein
MSPRKLYNFLIDPDLAEGLKAVKTRDGISESEQVRRAIRDWLSRKGVMKSGRKRVAPRERP